MGAMCFFLGGGVFRVAPVDQAVPVGQGHARPGACRVVLPALHGGDVLRNAAPPIRAATVTAPLARIPMSTGLPHSAQDRGGQSGSRYTVPSRGMGHAGP